MKKNILASKSLAAMAVLACFWSASATTFAGTSAADTDRLGKDLTPMGSEKAGNSNGSIPAWDGGIAKAPAGYDPKAGYLDPFASEKPLYTITAANMPQYKEKLAPGQMEMLKRFPDYKINVYPSHRTTAYPQVAYDSIKAEAGKIELA